MSKKLLIASDSQRLVFISLSYVYVENTDLNSY
jgi:hypothetical protein